MIQTAPQPQQAAQPDYGRIKSNISTMIDKGAPEADIDAYVASEGVTPEQLQQVPHGPASPDNPAQLDQDGTNLQGQFGDDPNRVYSQFAPEDEAHVVELLRTGKDDEAARFAASKGFNIDNAADIAKARAQTGAINPDMVYNRPKVSPLDTGGAAGAATRGILDSATLGLAGKAGNLTRAVEDQLSGSKTDFMTDWNREADIRKGVDDADSADHPWTRFAGQLAGGAILPTGLEGLAARVEAEAISGGATVEQAHAAGLRAIRNRIIQVGGGYGAAHGAFSADNPADAAIGAISEGALGAAGGAALGYAGQKLAPLIAEGGNRLYNAGRSAVSGFTKEGASDRAATVLRSAATRPLADILQGIETAPIPTEGVRPTLGEVAGDAGIAGLQRGHANTDPITAASVGERHASNALARTQAVETALGDGSPQAIQDTATARVQAAEQATAGQKTARQAAIDARLEGERAAATSQRVEAQARHAQAIEALGPVADRDATGASARGQFDQAYTAAKQRSRDAYAEPALASRAKITIPRSIFAKLQATADDFYGDGGGTIPGPLQEILSDAAEPSSTMRTLTNIDRRLADFAGESRMRGRSSEAAFAERFRRDFNTFVQDAAPDEYKAALANAKSVRSEQGRVFETGDAPTAFGRDRYGNPSVGDNTVPSKLVRPGAAGGDTAEGLIRAIGPEASENIVRQEIRRVADEGGVNTAARARALAVRYGEAARRFPAVQRDLDALQGHAANLEAAHAGEQAALSAGPTREDAASLKEFSALHESILGTPLARIADPSQDPSSFVSSLLRRSDDGRSLQFLSRQIAGDADAESGLRRALGEYIVNNGAGPNFTAAGDQVPSVNKTRAAISNVVKRAGNILTTQQKIVLRTVSRELENANFAFSAGKPAGSETALNKTWTKSFSELMVRVPGGTKTKQLISKILSAIGNQDEVKQLITKSILDPEFAATLLKRPTEQHWLQVTGKIGPAQRAAIPQIGRGLDNVVQLQTRLNSALSPTRLAANQSLGASAGNQPQEQQRETQGAQP